MPHLIIFSGLLLCALMVSCVLSGCQPLVQPFRPEERSVSEVPFLVRDAGGIVVRNLDGMPEGAAPVLVEALIKGLQRLDIPATTADNGVNRRSLFLDGAATATSVDGARLKVAIDWVLSDRDGHVVARPQTLAEVRAASWGTVAPEAFTQLGGRAVEAVAAVIQDPTAVAAAASDPGAAAAPGAVQRRFVVRPVTGAPGNGGAVLSRAMSASLRAARLPVATEVDDQALVIAGTVRVAPPVDGRQKVEIVWSVQDSGGREIAKLAQANAVPAGQLDGDWGDIAPLITDAALPGIMDLLRQLPAQAQVGAVPRSGG
jgi:hypothetical protein